MQIKNNKMTEKIDSKQWIPIYGIYRAVKDDLAGKPSFLDGRKYSLQKLGSAVYQMACITTASAGVAVGISLLEKILK